MRSSLPYASAQTQAQDNGSTAWTTTECGASWREVCQRCTAMNWSGSGLGLHHNLEPGHQDDEEIYADR